MCTGREKAFTHEAVRAYAVETLEKASDHELLTFLLQLVQALRYEPVDPDQVNAAGEGDAVNEAYVSPLARFLISRAKRSLEVANFLYWYLTAEKGDATHGAMYQNILKYFMRSLEEDEESARIGRLLRAQASYLHKIGQCQVQAREEKGRKDQKEECMRRLLVQNKLDHIHGEVDAVPNPLQPSTFFDGLLTKGTFMFKSATYPAVVEFLLKVRRDASTLQRPTTLFRVDLTMLSVCSRRRRSLLNRSSNRRKNRPPPRARTTNPMSERSE